MDTEQLTGKANPNDVHPAPGEPEDELDELEEEEPSHLHPLHARDPNRLRASQSLHSSNSKHPGPGAGLTNSQGGRVCIRCIKANQRCVLGTGASCLRCRAMHQSCSLVGNGNVDPGAVGKGGKGAENNLKGAFRTLLFSDYAVNLIRGADVKYNPHTSVDCTSLLFLYFTLSIG